MMTFLAVCIVLLGIFTNGVKSENLSKDAYYSSFNQTVAGCSYDTTCNAGGYEGVCVSISTGCCSSGVTTSGLCPGSSDIKCCTQSSCSTPSGSGTCMQTSLCSSKGGKSFSGYCTGPSDLQCCVQGATPTTGHYGVDVNVAITTTVANCLKSSGIEYVIPRGYRSTGVVDTLVCDSIKTAAKAGINVRDTYIFPCKPLPSHNYPNFTPSLLRPYLFQVR